MAAAHELIYRPLRHPEGPPQAQVEYKLRRFVNDYVAPPKTGARLRIAVEAFQRMAGEIGSDGRAHPARADALRRGVVHPGLRRDGRPLLAGPHREPLGSLPRPRRPADATTPSGSPTSTCAGRRRRDGVRQAPGRPVPGAGPRVRRAAPRRGQPVPVVTRPPTARRGARCRARRAGGSRAGAARRASSNCSGCRGAAGARPARPLPADPDPRSAGPRSPAHRDRPGRRPATARLARPATGTAPCGRAPPPGRRELVEVLPADHGLKRPPTPRQRARTRPSGPPRSTCSGSPRAGRGEHVLQPRSGPRPPGPASKRSAVWSR